MKPEKLFLVLFICMGVLLTMLYGRFELGGWEMERCQKMIFGTLVCVFVIIVVGVILIYIYECFQCNSNVYRIYVSDTGSIETQGDIHSFYVLKDEKNDIVPKNTEAVIYCGNDILKKKAFEDISSLKCLAFAKNAHKIEKDLYKMFLENNVNISVCSESVLMIVNEKGEVVSSVNVIQRTGAKEQQKCAVTVQVNH